MQLPAFDTLALSLDGHVAEVFLNRPEKANAMNAAMWPELRRCFEWLDAEPSVRAVVLAGNGKHFCAGIDLEMLAEMFGEDMEPARRAEAFRRHVLGLQDSLSALAAIHRSCVGGGIDMVTCCDMRYASEDARFSVREVDVGLAADVGTLQRLPGLIPDGIAREMAYTARSVEAQEAREIGLVNRRGHRGESAAGDSRHQGNAVVQPRPQRGRRPELRGDVECGHAQRRRCARGDDRPHGAARRKLPRLSGRAGRAAPAPGSAPQGFPGQLSMTTNGCSARAMPSSTKVSFSRMLRRRT